MLRLRRGCVLAVTVTCFLALISPSTSQMFDKRPTLYDHMKSGANTVKSNLIESELKIEILHLPDECKVDEDNFYEDRDSEINEAKWKRRRITAEDGDTVTILFTVALDDGTVIERSLKQSDDVHVEDEITPAIFQIGYGRVIPGWEVGINGMCLGEKRMVTIPPQLAYGSKGLKEKNIPPDVTLEIETELVGLKKKDYVDHYMDFVHSLHVYAFFILGLSFLMGGFYKGVIANKRRLYREIAERQRRLEESDDDDDDDELEEAEVIDDDDDRGSNGDRGNNVKEKSE